MSHTALPDREKDLSLLWARYRETRSPELLNQLVSLNMGLVRSHVWAWVKKQPHLIAERDYLESEASEGLLTAVRKYDGRPDVKFSTYAAYFIKGKIKDCLCRRKTSYQYHPALEEVPDQREVISGIEDEENLAEIKMTIESLIGILRQVEQDVLLLHYLEGLPFAEIAERLQLKANRVKDLHDRALYRIQRSI